jgi:peptidoglycan/LPS O-acetylase OafA/YrhL
MLRVAFDSAFALFVSPAIVLVASNNEPSSPGQARICGQLGAISYPIYALHWSFLSVISGATRRVLHGPVRPEWQPWSGMLVLAGLVAVAVVANKADISFRSWLTHVNRRWIIRPESPRQLERNPPV